MLFQNIALLLDSVPNAHTNHVLSKLWPWQQSDMPCLACDRSAQHTLALWLKILLWDASFILTARMSLYNNHNLLFWLLCKQGIFIFYRCILLLMRLKYFELLEIAGVFFFFSYPWIPMPLIVLVLNTVPQCKNTSFGAPEGMKCRALNHANVCYTKKGVSCSLMLHHSGCCNYFQRGWLTIFRAKTLSSIERFSSCTPFFLQQVTWQYMKQH